VLDFGKRRRVVQKNWKFISHITREIPVYRSIQCSLPERDRHHVLYRVLQWKESSKNPQLWLSGTKFRACGALRNLAVVSPDSAAICAKTGDSSAIAWLLNTADAFSGELRDLCSSSHRSVYETDLQLELYGIFWESMFLVTQVCVRNRPATRITWYLLRIETHDSCYRERHRARTRRPTTCITYETDNS